MAPAEGCQQNQYLVLGYLRRVSNLKLLALAVQRMKSTHLQDFSPLFPASGAQWHSKCSELEKAQPAELETAVLWQGAFLAGRHWLRALWICLQNSVPFCDGVAERTKPLHKPNPDYSPWMFTNILLFILLFPPTVCHCVSLVQSVYKLSTVGDPRRNTGCGAWRPIIQQLHAACGED